MAAQNSLIPEMNSFEGFGNGIGDIELTNYGYSGDFTPDTNSNKKRTGRGGTRPLTPGFSIALDHGLEQRLGAKVGALLRIWDSNGNSRIVENADRVPDSSVDGSGTADLYLPDSGRNDFYGKISKIEVLAQGDGRMDEQGAHNTLGMLLNMFPEEAAKMADRIMGRSSPNQGNQENQQGPQQQAQDQGQDYGPPQRKRPPNWSELTSDPFFQEQEPEGRVEILEGWRKDLFSRVPADEEGVKKVNALVDARIETERAGRGFAKETGLAVKEAGLAGLGALVSGITGTAATGLKVAGMAPGAEHAQRAKVTISRRTKKLESLEEEFSGYASRIAAAKTPEEKNSLRDEAKKIQEELSPLRKELKERKRGLEELQGVREEHFETLGERIKASGEKGDSLFQSSVDQWTEESDLGKWLSDLGIYDPTEGLTNVVDGPMRALTSATIGGQKKAEEATVAIDTAVANMRERSARSEAFKSLAGGYLEPVLMATVEMPLLIAQSMTPAGNAALAMNLGKRRADEMKALDPDMSTDEYFLSIITTGPAEMMVERAGINKLFGGKATATGDQIRKAILAEAAEEPIQSIVGLELASAIAGENVDTVFTEEAFKARMHEAVVGGVVGTIVSAPKAVAARKGFENAAKTAENKLQEASTPAQVEQAATEMQMNEEIAAQIEKDVSSEEGMESLKKQVKARKDAAKPKATEVPEADFGNIPASEDTIAEQAEVAEEAPAAEAEPTSPRKMRPARRTTRTDPPAEPASPRKMRPAKRTTRNNSTPEVTKDATLDSQDSTIDESSPPEAAAEVVAQEGSVDASTIPTALDFSAKETIGEDLFSLSGKSFRHTGSDNPSGSFFMEPSENSNFSDPSQPSSEFKIKEGASSELYNITEGTEARNRGVTVSNPAVHFLKKRGVSLKGRSLKELEAEAKALAEEEGIDVIVGYVHELDVPLDPKDPIVKTPIVREVMVIDSGKALERISQEKAPKTPEIDTPAPTTSDPALVKLGEQYAKQRNLADETGDAALVAGSDKLLEKAEKRFPGEGRAYLEAQAQAQTPAARKDFVPNKVKAVPAPEVPKTREERKIEERREIQESHEVRNDFRQPRVADPEIDHITPEDGKVRESSAQRVADKVFSKMGEIIALQPRTQQRVMSDRLVEVMDLAEKISNQRTKGRENIGAGELGSVPQYTVALTEQFLNGQKRSIFDPSLSEDELGKLLNQNSKYALQAAQKQSIRKSGGEITTNVTFEDVEDRGVELNDDGEFDDAGTGGDLNRLGTEEAPEFLDSRLVTGMSRIDPKNREILETWMKSGNDDYTAGIVMFPELINRPEHIEEAAWRKKVQDKFARQRRKAVKDLKENSQDISLSPNSDLGFLNLMEAMGNEDAALDDLMDLESQGALDSRAVLEYLTGKAKEGPVKSMAQTLLRNPQVAGILKDVPFSTEYLVAGGQYFHESAAITLDQHWMTPSKQNRAFTTMLHESIHALTIQVLEMDTSFAALAEETRQALLATLPAEVQARLSEMTAKELADEIRMELTYEEIFGVKPEGNPADAMRIAYAATNTLELVANGLSEPSVMMALMDVPPTRPRFYKNLWRQIMDGFRSYLNIGRDNAFTNLFENFAAGVESEGFQDQTLEYFNQRREEQKKRELALAELFDGVSLSPEASKKKLTPEEKKRRRTALLEKNLNKKKAQFGKAANAWLERTDYEGQEKKSLQWQIKSVMEAKNMSLVTRDRAMKYMNEFMGNMTMNRPPNRRALGKAAATVQSGALSDGFAEAIRKGSIKQSVATRNKFSRGQMNDTSIERALSNTKLADKLVRGVTSIFTDGLVGSPHRGASYAQGETNRMIKKLEETYGKHLTTYESHTKPAIVNHLLTISPKLTEQGLTKGEQVAHSYFNLKASTENVDKAGDTMPKHVRDANVVNKRLLRELAPIAIQGMDGNVGYKDIANALHGKLTPNQRGWAKGMLEVFESVKGRVKVIKEVLDAKGTGEFTELEGFVPLVARSTDYDTSFENVDLENLETHVHKSDITERHLTHAFDRSGVGGSSYYVLSGKESVRAALANINTDYHTLPQRQILNRFLGNGSEGTSVYEKLDARDGKAKGTIDTVKHIVNKQVTNEMNKSRLGSSAVRAINELKSFGYVRALSHIGQLANQSMPLVAYAAVNPTAAMRALSYGPQFFSEGAKKARAWADVNANDIMSRELDGALDKINRSALVLPEGQIERGAVMTGRGMKRLNQLLGDLYIGSADRLATQGIFFSSYMKHAKANGTITSMTYEEAFADPSKVDFEALNQARRDVTNYNAESADAKKGSHFQRSDGWKAEAFRNLLLIFKTHQASIASNITASASQIKNGDADTKREGYKNLAGAILSEALWVAASSGFAWLLLGMGGDEEEVDKKLYRRAVGATYTSLPYANLFLNNTVSETMANFMMDRPMLSGLSKAAAESVGISPGDATVTYRGFSSLHPDFSKMAGAPGIAADDIIATSLLIAGAGEGDAQDLALLMATYLVGQPKTAMGILPDELNLKVSDIRKRLEDRQKARQKEEK